MGSLREVIMVERNWEQVFANLHGADGKTPEQEAVDSVCMLGGVLFVLVLLAGLGLAWLLA